MTIFLSKSILFISIFFYVECTSRQIEPGDERIIDTSISQDSTTKIQIKNQRIADSIANIEARKIEDSLKDL